MFFDRTMIAVTLIFITFGSVLTGNVDFGRTSIVVAEMSGPSKSTATHNAQDAGEPLVDIVAPYDWYRYQGKANDTNCPQTNADCGPAAVAMVIAYAKSQMITIAAIRQFLGSSCSEVTGLEDVERALQNWNVSSSRLEKMEDIVNSINVQGKIVIVPLSMSILPHGEDYNVPNSDPSTNKNSYKDPGNHWLVVKGISNDGRWIIAYDPNVFGEETGRYWYSDKTPKGKDRYYDINAFRAAFETMGVSALMINDIPKESVRGVVKDLSGNPVSEATVVLSDNRKRYSPLRTDTAGRYSFVDVIAANTYVVAVKGNTVTSESVAQARDQELFLNQTLSQGIVLPADGTLRATFVSTGAPGDETACSGEFALAAPRNVLVFHDYLTYAGISAEIGNFKQGDSLLFSLAPSSFCIGGPYLSDDSSRAVIAHPDDTTWLIGWEDWLDSDFNDLIVRIDLEPRQQAFLSLPIESNLAAATTENGETTASLLTLVDAFMDHDPTPRTAIFSGYGSTEVSPMRESQITYNGNQGTDFGVGRGTSVIPAASGIVQYAGEQAYECAPDGRRVVGNVIRVRHANDYVTEYWWLGSINSSILEGVNVTPDTTILGQSGFNACKGTEGLHFVVRNARGIAVDPFGWKPNPYSFWATLDDPWQTYQDQNATSYPLWTVVSESANLFDPAMASVFTSASGNISVSLPQGSSDRPFRLEISQEGLPMNVDGNDSQTSFSVLGFSEGDEILTQLILPADIAVTHLDASGMADSALFFWEPESASWHQLPSVFDLNTNTLTATTLRIGTFAVAPVGRELFLPMISR